MNREKLLKVAKPILFNTEMVRAILGDRKTQTRRAIKIDEEKIYKLACCNGKWNEADLNVWEHILDWYAKEKAKSRYKVGDILYVRETWQNICACPLQYAYKADGEFEPYSPWKPSIHMPKDAARIFLKVTNVRVEMLQDISVQNAKDEGIKVHANGCVDGLAFGCYNGDKCVNNICTRPIEYFAEIWDSTQKAPNKFMSSPYRWERNPWVFAYEFERMVAE